MSIRGGTAKLSFIVNTLILPLTFYSSPSRGEVKRYKEEKEYCLVQKQYKTGQREGVKRFLSGRRRDNLTEIQEGLRRPFYLHY